MSQQQDSSSDPTDRGPTAPPVGSPRPVVPVSATAAARLRLRELDPASDGATLSPTRYVGDTLLVPGPPDASANEALRILETFASERTLACEIPSRDEAFEQFLHDNDIAGRVDRAASTSIRFVRVGAGEPTRPVNAWKLLQEAREDAGRNAVLGGVGLAHVLGPAVGLQGVGGGYSAGVGGGYSAGVGGGYSAGVGGGYSAGVGNPFALYGAGRAPVEWSAPSPRPEGGGEWGHDGPVVAVIDTGVGAHPWFDEGVVRELTIPVPDETGTLVPRRVGLNFDPADDPEQTGVTVDRVNGTLDPLSGHGTFIAGIIRQRCPSATIVSIPIMYGDGSADERDLIEALRGLLVHHLLALTGKTEGRPIDVVSLSLGYYHEAPVDVAASEVLAGVLKELADAGVAVVAAVGNDAVEAPFYPAALARFTDPRAIGEPDGPDELWPGVPMVSVGATTMDHPFVASYSNTGRWVRRYRPGTNVVSTMPTTFDGSGHASLRTSGVGTTATGFTVPARATPDLDNYRGGFGIWGGTSFAAPVFAAEVAAELASTSALTGDRVTDGTAAVDAVLERRP